MPDFVVVLDTCVLYPPTLRHLLLQAASIDLFRPVWSADVLGELRRNLAGRVGMETADRLVGELIHLFPATTIPRDENLVSSMANHPADRHILAAAVQSGAGIIVTDNLGDFPPASVAPFAALPDCPAP